MGKKIIFLDIDGTLCQPGSNDPPPSALTAIQKARAAGNLVFLCTGRNMGMLSPLLKYGFDGVVASSGGYVTCGDTVVYNCPMTFEQQKQATDILRENGIYLTVECRDCSYTDESFRDFLRAKGEKQSNSELLRWREQLEADLGILPMSVYPGDPIYKMVLMCEDPEQLRRPMEVLGGQFLFVVQNDQEHGYINGEMLPRCCDKGQGVRRICRHLGIPVEDSYGYGDSINDKEMMETVGHSVAMNNASPSLKAMAHEVCPSVEQDGIYKSFQLNHLF